MSTTLNANLINTSFITANQAVDNSGSYVVGSYAGFSTILVAVTAGITYTFSGLTNTPSVRVRFQNSSGTFISGASLTGAMPFVFTVPAGATAAVLNCKEPTQSTNIYSSLQLIQGNQTYSDSFLQSTPAVALGDSFIAAYPQNWLNIVTADLNLACVGVGGSGYAVTRGVGTGGTPVGCILDLLSTVYSNTPGIVILQGGTNDCFYGMPIGQPTDASSSTSTYYGAYKYMIEQLQSNLLGVRIAILVPPQRATSQSGSYAKQLSYAAIPKNVAAQYSIPCLDLFATAWTQTTLQAGTNATTVDGAHPSVYGGSIMARLITRFLRQYL